MYYVIKYDQYQQQNIDYQDVNHNYLLILNRVVDC